MRNSLHPSLRLEVRHHYNKTKLRIPSKPVASRRDTTVTQVSSESSARPLEEACIAASATAQHGSDARAARRDRTVANSNEPRAATYPRNLADIDTHSGSSDSHYPHGLNGKETGAVKLKPGIVVIHGRAVFRDCFVQCLEHSYGDHEVFSFASVAEWRNSKEPNDLTTAVIIVVIESGDESNVADLELFETATTNIPVVIVSDVDDLDHIVRTLKSGVRGYIPTSLPFNIAVEAVRLVKAGGTFVPASSFVHDRGAHQTALKTSVLLTERQMKVVEEIRHGKANKQIAYELNMSEHTVKVHLRHIMRKLKARNRTEVAVMSEDLFAGFGDHKRADSDIRPG